MRTKFQTPQSGPTFLFLSPFLKYFFGGFFLFFFFVQYSAMLHLPPLRFHCADGSWDLTQECGPAVYFVLTHGDLQQREWTFCYSVV
jgi:hypothetical protein